MSTANDQTPKIETYIVTMPDGRLFVCHADDVHLAREDGHLSFFNAGRCLAIFAPGGWLSYTLQEVIHHHA